MTHTRGDRSRRPGLILRDPLLLLAVTPLLSSCATAKAVQAYPEATWALLEAFVSDILSIFTFLL